MGVRFPSVFSNTFIGPLPGNANETVVLQCGPLELPVDNAPVLICWCWTLTAGTGTTAIAARALRGTSSSNVGISVQKYSTLLAAGAIGSGSGCIVDAAANNGGQSYCLAITQTGATVQGVWIEGWLMAFVL